MRLGLVTWLIPSSAAQEYGRWIFWCLRDPPALSGSMSGCQHRGNWHRTSASRWSEGDGIDDGRSDGWAELRMKDREPWSCTGSGRGRPDRG